MDTISKAVWAAEDGRRMYKGVWKDVSDSYLERVKASLVGMESNNFEAQYIAEILEDEVGIRTPEDDKRYAILITAGARGNGIWTNYLEDTQKIFKNLIDPEKGKFKEAYLILWVNDENKDISNLYIGVK